MRTRHLAALLATAILLTIATAQAFAHAPAHQPSAQEVVAKYFAILNAGMKSGDFSDLASVFASDATQTRSTPKGVTTVYHGLAAITSFYQTLPKAAPGYQWTTDSMRALSPTVVIAYERAGSPPLKVAGRCFHVFTIENGKIETYEWVVFFPGVK